MKVKLTFRWLYPRADIDDRQSPVGNPETVLIDTEDDHRYDGAETLEDVQKTFLEFHTFHIERTMEPEIIECEKIQ